MLTTCDGSARDNASSIAFAISMLSISIERSLQGARAATATTASPGRSIALSRSAASGACRSTSLRETPSTDAPSACSRATIALPTKPPAPITTVRCGNCSVAFR